MRIPIPPLAWLALKLLEWIRSERRSVTIGSPARVDTREPVQGARV